MPVLGEGTWLVRSLCREAVLFQLFIKLSAALSLCWPHGEGSEPAVTPPASVLPVLVTWPQSLCAVC